MKRLAVLSTTLLLALGAAGCGKGPEDKAQDAGQTIGEAIAEIRTATSAEDAGQQIDSIAKEFSSIKDELPSAYNEQLKNIVEELKASVSDAGGDPAKIREAFADAISKLRELNSATNSVVNELVRGVREGYDNAMN